MVGRIFRNLHDVGKWLVGTGNRNMRVVGYGWEDIQERASDGNIFTGYSGTGEW
jgi:hypothetical protein